ncbi:MAG: glucose 1-dehydrogenase [Steroidobacteraceae bacterium]
MAGMVAGKVALVTGGGSGIGRAAALKFAEEGANVVIADISEPGAAQTADMVRKLGREALVVKTDVTKTEDLRRMVTATIEKFGRLDAAFNNAGHPGHWTNAKDCTEEEWDFLMNIDLKSVWLSMKFEIEAMLTSGGGNIVNTSSGAGLRPSPGMVAYVSMKHAVVGLTKSAAKDFGQQNIRVNAILPGPTLTPMLEEGFRGMNMSPQFAASTVSMNRLGRPEEQAEAVVWLCSDRSSFVTGVALPVDGGWLL